MRTSGSRPPAAATCARSSSIACAHVQDDAPVRGRPRGRSASAGASNVRSGSCQSPHAPGRCCRRCCGCRRCVVGAVCGSRRSPPVAGRPRRRESSKCLGGRGRRVSLAPTRPHPAGAVALYRGQSRGAYRGRRCVARSPIEERAVHGGTAARAGCCPRSRSHARRPRRRSGGPLAAAPCAATPPPLSWASGCTPPRRAGTQAKPPKPATAAGHKALDFGISDEGARVTREPAPCRPAPARRSDPHPVAPPPTAPALAAPARRICRPQQQPGYP